ncbi:MAG: phosphopantetheine adenylyltransferase [Alphaproteobacteria bacterium PA4]|nr:MAG: phosphopantetheine adenylyltransferase [Alphaproteobacteria bacterium PA4]
MAVTVAWLLLAALHLVPALALLRPALLTRLYGAAPGDLGFALLRHRAALFLVVFIIAVWAAFDAAVRPLAVVTVAVSMLSFLLIHAASGRPAALRGIASADMMGLLPLAFVTWEVWG